MSEPLKLRYEVDRALARLEVYEMVLHNIAVGNWNIGRKRQIGANDYAREALDLFQAGATDPALHRLDGCA